jgi:hypothetical protein
LIQQYGPATAAMVTIWQYFASINEHNRQIRLAASSQ